MMPIHTKSFNVLLLEMDSTGKKEKIWGWGWRETAKKENRFNLQAEFNRSHKILYQTNNNALFSGVAEHFPQSPSPRKKIILEFTWRNKCTKEPRIF